jgi:hypothetical protein
MKKLDGKVLRMREMFKKEAERRMEDEKRV